MKSFPLTAILIFTIWTITLGQDKELETRLYKQRTKIRDSRIKEITERVSHWKNPCVKDSSEIRIKHEFNKNGDLLQTDEFHRGHYWKTISYVRNKGGDYTQKTYTFYDSVDNIKVVDSWIFEFNKKGQRVSEIWGRENDTIRINILSYDRKGNYTEQFTDGWLKWRFKYNNKNNVIESEECRLVGDTTQCRSLTKYQYENGLLKRHVIYSKGDDIREEFNYTYDSANNLIKMTVHRHTFVQYGSEPKKKDIYVITYTFENDDKGNCIVKSEFLSNEDKPFRCTYYDYKYY